MNLYKQKEIKNDLDIRLMDLFVIQNQSNDWLSIDDCASWVFETNEPTEYHRTYTRHKLISLVGDIATSVRAKTAFDIKYDPETRGRFVYRLKNAEDVQKRAGVMKLELQIDEAYAENTLALMDW